MTTPRRRLRVSIAVLAALGGCGTAGTPRGAEPAVASAGAFPGGPTAPTDGLALPSLDVPWVPPTSSRGDLEPIRDALGEADAVVLAAPGAWLTRPLDGASLPEVVAGLVPGPRWVAPQSLGSSSVDAGWAARVGEGVDAIVVIDHAVPDAPETGTDEPDDSEDADEGDSDEPGCTSLVAALAAGQEHGLAEVEPFLAHLDALMLQVYRPAVAAMAPRWLEELAPYVDAKAPHDPADADAEARHACGRAYLAHVRDAAACARRDGESCRLAPRSYLRGGLRIGLQEPEDGPAQARCAALVGRDYDAELEGLAREAVEAIAGSVDARWLQLADRTGSLTTIYEEVHRLCAPARRRFDPADLEVAQARVAALGDALAGPLLPRAGGRFVPASDRFEAGVGTIVAVADYDGGPASPAERAITESRGVAHWLSTRARCLPPSDDAPWRIRVIDPATGQVTASALVDPEALTCSP